jgi:hypothetical protein
MMFGLQALQLKNTILIRCAGIRVRTGGAFVRLQAHCVILRPCYLQIRSASTPPSPTRPRRRRHHDGRTPVHTPTTGRRVRIASGLRDPLRHVVVTALDLPQQACRRGWDGPSVGARVLSGLPSLPVPTGLVGPSPSSGHVVYCHVGTTRC